MPCGCGGGQVQQSIPATSGDAVPTQSASATPGMPRYKVVGSGNGDSPEFATYGEARDYKQRYGGNIRAK